jgi:predicted membrane-bound mannosyltransferase
MDVFGSGDVAVRGLSGLFGIATLPLVWILGRRKGGTVLAWVAVAVVAVSPFAVRYSNETRMYSLVILLVVIGWLLIDDIVDRKKSTVGRFIGVRWCGTSLLALLEHLATWSRRDHVALEDLARIGQIDSSALDRYRDRHRYCWCGVHPVAADNALSVCKHGNALGESFTTHVSFVPCSGR